VWAVVAAELLAYRRSGLGGLLTEDVVRFATARALVRAGVDPAGLRVEWPHPVLKGSRVDLIAGGNPPAALFEFKFPREPNEQNAAWTMALGEVLKDLYRLAVCPGHADRLFVYVESARLRSYMAGAARRYGFDLDLDEVSLRPIDAARLPTTAAQTIGAELAAHHVTARRIALESVDDTLRVAVYEVDAIDSGTIEGIAQQPSKHVTVAAGPGDEMPESRYDEETATRAGARQEILDAVQAVLTRSGRQTFTMADIVGEMIRRGTRYAESTVRTMIGSHMCKNAPDNAGVTYDDFERVDRGTYRLSSLDPA
jgi:hypothetical protein